MMSIRWRASCWVLLSYLLSCVLLGRGESLAATADVLAHPSADATSRHAANDDWFSVHLQGRKIGQMRSQRSQTPRGIETITELMLELERHGERLPLLSRQTTLETLDGKPISFSNRLDTGGTLQSVTGTITDGQLDLVRRLGVDQAQDDRVEESMPWPSGAVLAEGARLAARAAGSEQGSTYDIRVFDLDALRAIPVAAQVGGMQSIDIHDRRQSVIAHTQRYDFGGSTLELQLWLDPRTFLPRRLRMPMLGVEMEMLVCDESCATAPNQISDVLAATSVPSPRALSRSERAAPLIYTVVVEGAEDSTSSIVPGQIRTRDADEMRILVDPDGDSRLAPTEHDTQPNRWLQSDHAELVALAQALTGRSTSASSMMRKLERGVARQLATKSLRIGYASALEAARLKEGDCTEHALLLAALARASGIPARVATGLAYAPNYSGRDDLFVPHAWVYAWVDGRWRGYDAALPSFGSGHLALDIGDGDPFNFYSDIGLLGSLSIRSITPPTP